MAVNVATLNDKIKRDVSRKHALEMRELVLDKAGVAMKTYYRYLNGECQDQRIGLAMADFLGISLENLLDPSFSLVGIVKVSNQKEVV